MTYNVFGGTLSLTQSINQPSRLTQPGIPSWVGAMSTSRSAVDALRLVKLCDPIVAHGPYLSALEINGL